MTVMYSVTVVVTIGWLGSRVVVPEQLAVVDVTLIDVVFL